MRRSSARTAERVELVPVAELVLDYNLYPRHKVDPYRVRGMVVSQQIGKSLPPIIVDAEDKRVIDGFHRVGAQKRFGGPNSRIRAILKNYSSEDERYEEAMRLNATHGASLTAYDKARCVLRAVELGMDPQRIAGALSVTVETVEELRTARVATDQGEPLPLKFTSQHMAGEALSLDQVRYNVKAGGMSQLFYVNQVVAMLENNAVNWKNDNLVAGLQKLSGFLASALAARPAQP